MALFRLHVALAAVALSACARPELADPSLSSQTAAMIAESRLTPMVDSAALDRLTHHVLLTLKLSPAGLSVVDAREVDTPLQRPRAPSPEAWRVAVQDANGKLLYLAQLKPPAGVRAEFAREDGSIEAAHVSPSSESVLTVRVPVLRGAATVRIYGRADTLPADDARVQGARPEAMVELGKVAYPQLAEAR